MKENWILVETGKHQMQARKKTLLMLVYAIHFLNELFRLGKNLEATKIGKILNKFLDLNQKFNDLLSIKTDITE